MEQTRRGFFKAIAGLIGGAAAATKIVDASPNTTRTLGVSSIDGYYCDIEGVDQIRFNRQLQAAAKRGFSVYDSVAQPGQFTIRLISLMKTALRRRAPKGMRAKLDTIYVPPFALDQLEQDVRDKCPMFDEVTRQEILVSAARGITKIYGANMYAFDLMGRTEKEHQNLCQKLGLSNMICGEDKFLCLGRAHSIYNNETLILGSF